MARTVALLAEGVDRNGLGHVVKPSVYPSPSSRRAWIEITPLCCSFATLAVALLAEGVDRNCYDRVAGISAPVALLAEGVDRNASTDAGRKNNNASPSSRRAWIEIPSESD